MPKYAILQISDLHITKFKTSKRVFESRMENIDYLRLFIQTLKELEGKLDINIKTIIISGDLANESTPIEYKKVGEYLDEIIKEFSLESSDFLIVPGNHDINWVYLQSQYGDYIVDTGEIDPYKLHEDKLNKFKVFYDRFYEGINEKLNCKKAICTKKYIDELDLLILGINSVHRESFKNEDHIGWIDYDSLKLELKEICAEYENSFKIAVFHHSPIIISGHNEGVIENWSTVKELFDEYNVSTYFYGHTHASLRDSRTKKYEYVGCGSFALSATNISNFFNLYILDIKDDNQLKFKLNTYRFNPSYEGRFNQGEWTLADDKSGEVEVLKKYIINTLIKDLKTQVQSDALAEENPFSTSENEIQKLLSEKVVEIVESNKADDNLSSKFIELINRKKLFKSGHFHWGKNSRSHGWIDTNTMLSDYECLKLSINALIYLINESAIKADLVIGIGMEGNLLASQISIVIGSRYTYVPVSNRENSDFESKFDIKDCKSVILITDTVFSGQTVNQILNEHNEFFEGLENITLISIFYTGSMVDELIKRVNFNYKYVCDKIKINSCNNDSESCPVYINRLDTIYEF